MSPHNPQDALRTACKTLNDQWQETRRQWRDAAAMEFERCYWQQVEQHTRELEKAAANFDDSLDRALRETSEVSP